MNEQTTDLSDVRARFAVALEMYVGGDITMRAIGAYLGMAPSHVHYAVHAEAARLGMRIVCPRGRSHRRRELRPLAGEGEQAAEWSAA